jgi:hypothetical protein
MRIQSSSLTNLEKSAWLSQSRSIHGDGSQSKHSRCRTSDLQPPNKITVTIPPPWTHQATNHLQRTWTLSPPSSNQLSYWRSYSSPHGSQSAALPNPGQSSTEPESGHAISSTPETPEPDLNPCIRTLPTMTATATTTRRTVSRESSTNQPLLASRTGSSKQ